ncbi:MAG: hypothetical protein GWM93_05005 [Gemmatimonadetes bacterium]|uniref:Uncharacterized protein n=1 Tax=Candidatus Kutchimonas denitrificans TaxID=3056748 RepID=A0AAE4ZC92_9BACT|nr:hypothetical protein [Gemmatimonadota bacterium]NIR75776.1 hypothetical protein [Candidatus Kutchimonas denitrificans]NIT66039.1 hypothetical protein [Gemmatimonadota bacterium]NIY34617.1 hypothetical protein [Gemmatimonadota bacterium]NIY42854.1 hypothetical protein [Gemmatimonadota bacterium]
MRFEPTRFPALAIAALSIALLRPQPATAQGFASCIDFDDLSVGTQYHVGDSFMSGGVTITAEAFTWGNGNTTTGGFAEVDDNNLAGGSGLDVEVNNINLRFALGTADGLTLLFGEYGGNLNLEINGDFRNFENFNQLNGASVGGTSLVVTGGAGNDQGTLAVDGTISSFAIGGQELWIDNVCPGGESQRKSRDVSLFMGGLFTSDSLPLNSGFNTGFRFTYTFYRGFWLELETGIGFTETFADSGLLGHAQLQLRWHPTPTEPVDPFILVGAGAVTYNTIGANESSPVVVLGLGANFHWLDEVGFRFDINDFWVTDMFGQSEHNFRILWGPIFWF